MKQLITNNMTGEVVEIDIEEVVEVIDKRTSMPTTEERLDSVETTQSQVIDVLAEMTGVTL